MSFNIPHTAELGWTQCPSPDRTFVLLKPECTEEIRHQIIKRLKQKLGWKIVAMGTWAFCDAETAAEHYIEHKDKPFFPALVAHFVNDTTSVTRIDVLVIEGRDAVNSMRKMIGGKADPKDCPPGSIRFDFASEMSLNCIHASDSPEAAAREIAIWFDCGQSNLAS